MLPKKTDANNTETNVDTNANTNTDVNLETNTNPPTNQTKQKIAYQFDSHANPITNRNTNFAGTLLKASSFNDFERPMAAADHE